MAAVDLVTIHHEGGGAPSDNVGRYSEGGYCYGIGITLWERWRAPADNWATLDYNGEDLTICLSGNRMDYEVTDDDLELIHGAFMDSFDRDEVTPTPLVRAHRNSPGSATACPGDLTIARWDEVVAVCQAGGPPPTDEPAGRTDDMVIIGVEKAGAKGNEQPFGFLDPVARKVWSHWGFKIAWDGGDGDSVLHGDSAPRWIGVPGTAPLVGWDVLEVRNEGEKRVCAYGLNGAQYTGTAHG